MRDLGSIQAPQNAFLLNIGLETLHLRVPRHCENALKVAKYLKGHDKVAWVSYPSLEGDKYYDLAQKYMPNGTCGVLTFGLKGGREAAVEMMDKLKMVAIVTHVADTRSCVLHPGKPYSSSDERAGVERGGSSAGFDPFQCRNRERRRYYCRCRAGIKIILKKMVWMYTIYICAIFCIDDE